MIYSCHAVPPNVPTVPSYLKDVPLDASTETLYGSSRLISALADHSFNTCGQIVARYQSAVMIEGRKLVLAYDKRIAETGDASLCVEANAKLCAMAKEQTDKALTAVLHESGVTMKNGYHCADNGICETKKRRGRTDAFSTACIVRVYSSRFPRKRRHQENQITPSSLYFLYSLQKTAMEQTIGAPSL